MVALCANAELEEDELELLEESASSGIPPAELLDIGGVLELDGNAKPEAGDELEVDGGLNELRPPGMSRLTEG